MSSLMISLASIACRFGRRQACCALPPFRFKLSVLAVALCLVPGAFSQPAKVDDQTAIQIEALNRLKGMDLEANPALKSAVVKILDKTRGTPQFVEIVRDFNLKGHSTALLEYAQKHPTEPSGIEAFGLAMKEVGPASVKGLLDSTNAVAVVELIGNSKDKDLQQTLKNLVQETGRPLATRKSAVQTLARSEDGAQFLLDLATAEKLPADVKLIASSELNRAPWPAIKKSALELLPLPQTKNAEPLPPVAELVKRAGDAKRGREIFESQAAACSSCHIVNGKGTDVGPQLSEIGTKLGKEALYESILDPSSGISFGFEAWSIELQNGDELFGLVTNETGEELTVKSQTGVLNRVKKTEIAKRQKLSSSLMPQGLQLTMSTKDLVDLVEFLASLKKPVAVK
jgi:putative heme-binding domain-containing protein